MQSDGVMERVLRTWSRGARAVPPTAASSGQVPDRPLPCPPAPQPRPASLLAPPHGPWGLEKTLTAMASQWGMITAIIVVVILDWQQPGHLAGESAKVSLSPTPNSGAHLSRVEVAIPLGRQACEKGRSLT